MNGAMRRDLSIRRLSSEDIPECEHVLRALPNWFGIEEASLAYVQSLSTLPAYVAVENGEVVGFIATQNHTSVASEIHIIAVEPSKHRQGIGRALIDYVVRDLKAEGIELLQVKTLGPSYPDEGYRLTRKFYEEMGFLPLEETTKIWGPGQPCLLMVKHLVETRSK
jgi:N-acetylglutamate synthase-like GNAT family acetyltransferase